jgi:hypothetical protein
VVFSWKTAAGERATARGTTRNISVNGIFVAAGDCPPVAAVVRCHVLLPALEGSTELVAPLVLDVIGRVVRTEREDADTGFAIRMRRSTLTDS